MKEKKEDLEPE